MAELVKKWTHRWRALADGPGGGHGRSKVVVRADSASDEPRFFLKILKRQEDASRRARMYREVAAYRTLSHRRIPELVDSNAEAFDDTAYELYLATAYVPGPTLEEYIRDHGAVSWAVASGLVDAILETLDHCHQNDVVHRDVKPDNIVLRNGSVDDPVLVDFGQALGERDSFKTESGEELGNRFLRLPELSGGSAEKDNLRTDVTFAAGLLVYCLTGILPSTLLNERGLMPHQRPEVGAALAARFDAREKLDHLLGIFDRAFGWDVRERWASAGALRDAIQGVDAARPFIDATEKINRYAARPEVRSAAAMRRVLDQGIQAVATRHGHMAHELAGTFDAHSTGFTRMAASNAVEMRVAFTKQGVPAVDGDWLRIRVQAVAGDLVIRVIAADGADGPTIYRTPLEASAFDFAFEDALRRLFHDHIGRLI